MKSLLHFGTFNLVQFTEVHKIAYITFSSELRCYFKPVSQVNSVPNFAVQIIHGILSKWKFGIPFDQLVHFRRFIRLWRERHHE